MTSFRGSDYPLDLSFLSSSAENSAILESYLKSYNLPGEKIDYSEWSNHTTYQSAYSKYNIFLWRLFNEYNRTWSWNEWMSWWDTLNGFEKYSFKKFPSYSGHFFNSGSNSYIFGADYENKMSLTSSDNSLSIEFCCQLTASYAPGYPNQYIVKRGRDFDQLYYEVFLSASNEMIFRVQSGSTIFSASCPFSNSYYNVGHHFAFCYSSASAETRAYVDGELALVTSSSPIGHLILETGSLGVYIGSRSPEPPPGPPIGEYLEGSLDELRIWNSYRTSEQIAEYYNRHIHWEPELVLYVKFNEPHYITSDGSLYNVVYDYAKNPIDLRIQNYSAANKVSGSLVGSSGDSIMSDEYDYYDPIVLDDYSDVVTHINTIWESAKEYDSTNRYMITNLIPQSYLDEEESLKSYNLTNLLYLFARQLDEIKIHVQEIKNFHNAENVPYKLLQTAIKLYGLESFDNFPTATIAEYFIQHSASNNILYSIKDINEIFWRNILSNITYVYKTKGTKESIDAFMHCVGLNNEIISVKDYDSTYSYPITSSYIGDSRYVKILNFGGKPDLEDIEGTNAHSTASCIIMSASQLPYQLTNSLSIETLVSFKPYLSYESGTFFETIVTSQPYITTGSIWGIKHTLGGEICLAFERDLTSSYGNVYIETSGSSEGVIQRLTSSLIEIFDGEYYNISYRRNIDKIIPIHYLDIKKYDPTSEEIQSICSSVGAFITESFNGYLYVGAFSGSLGKQTETVQSEFRLWDKLLIDTELNSHCYDLTSVGSVNPEYDYVKLIGHWILDDGIQSNTSGTIQNITNYGYYKSMVDVTGLNFAPSTTGNFYSSLFEYKHLCPDISLKWNTNDIIYGEHDNINVDYDRVDMMSMEYNAIDALNRDMIRLFDKTNKVSYIIGVPGLEYRNEYSLKQFVEPYFTRLSGNISFINYFNNISGVDKFYMSIVEKLIPARTCFIGEEKVIESHLLERNKKPHMLPKNVAIYSTLGTGIRRS